MSSRFENRVVVVTGAAGQVGSETARRFVDEGAKVVATDIEEERLQAVVDQISDAGGEATAAAADLAQPGAAEQIIGTAERVFGPVYALAAIHGGIGRTLPGRDGSTDRRLTVGNISDAEWQRMMDREPAESVPRLPRPRGQHG